jgi:phage recombination protein Bet
MNAIAKTEQAALAAISEDQLLTVLQSSLYPGAALASIKMVLGYCKAAGLDPMLKPVHLVPMWDGKAKQMRDVVMPGIGLYRTQAARTGAFAGQSEPEFGPMITDKLSGVEITYPEFARVTVKKSMANGVVAEFTAIEYWIENYAVKGGQEKSIAPNAMWFKRPRGQIAKCAAAQALRLAFPEAGAQPTAEEMEGKALEDEYVTTVEAKPAVAEQPTWPTDKFADRLLLWKEAMSSGKKTVEGVITFALSKGALTDDQLAQIKALPAQIVKEAEPRKPEGRTGPSASFAQIAEAMRKAADMDALNDAASLITTVGDDAQAGELNGIYDQCATALN